MKKENSMKKLSISAYTMKIVLVFVLILLFLIPIALIKNLISDRKFYQESAVDSITEPFGGTTSMQGLVIAVPYRHRTETRNEKNEVTKVDVDTRYLIFAPESYDLDMEVEPYYLTRGIFKVPVFNGNADMKATFGVFDYSYFDIKTEDIMTNEAVLILGFSNTKSLTAQPKLKIGDDELSISPLKYNNISPFGTSVSYNLPDDIFDTPFDLTGRIEFQGGEVISLRPIASDNTFRMKSDWASPSFSGGWLPKEREISESGFSATWEIAGLSTIYPKSWQAWSKLGQPESVSTSFLVPVDAYKKSERSVKYALLFLMIPFIALLISEIFSKKRVHPVQYCLIGFADVIFYLLLLSISEHVPFDLTYLICAASVSLATLFYATSIFKSLKFGGMLSGVQLVSYIFLYGTLQAEDYALLIGSVGLFAVVLLLMFITRKIDWYQIAGNSDGDADEPDERNFFTNPQNAMLPEKSGEGTEQGE